MENVFKEACARAASCSAPSFQCHFSWFAMQTHTCLGHSNQWERQHFAVRAFTTLWHAHSIHWDFSSASISVPRCIATWSPLDFCRIKGCRRWKDQCLDENLYFPLPLQYWVCIDSLHILFLLLLPILVFSLMLHRLFNFVLSKTVNPRIHH